MEKNLTDLIFGVTVTIIHMHYYAEFPANLLNGVQNFHPKHQKLAKYGYFQTFKKSPKIEKKSDRPHFWYVDSYYPVPLCAEVCSQSVERCAKFPM